MPSPNELNGYGNIAALAGVFSRVSVMRFYFDIRFDGRFQRDHNGENFDSTAEARDYVIQCAHVCFAVASEAERAKLSRCSVLIVDETGAADFITFADVDSRPDPRGSLKPNRTAA